jgi:hypothetical protein
MSFLETPKSRKMICSGSGDLLEKLTPAQKGVKLRCSLNLPCHVAHAQENKGLQVCARLYVILGGEKRQIICGSSGVLV